MADGSIISERELGIIESAVQGATEKGHKFPEVGAEVTEAIWRGYESGIKALDPQPSNIASSGDLELADWVIFVPTKEHVTPQRLLEIQDVRGFQPPLVGRIVRVNEKEPELVLVRFDPSFPGECEVQLHREQLVGVPDLSVMAE